MAQGIEAAHDFAIKPLFAEPYFIANIGHAISSKQIDFIKSVKMQQNQMNHISEHLYLLRRPELASVRKAVDSALVSFAQEVLGIRHELAVTQSWALMNPPGVGMHEHTHSNSLVSGSLYYAPLPDPPGNMVFERTNGYRQIEMAVAEEKTNIYNAQRNAVIPKQGDLVLFSSSIMHFVEVNRSHENRHSVAFNAFPRGTIGNYQDVSELKL